MYRRYNAEFLHTDADFGIPAIDFAIEKEIDDKLFARWLVQAQFQMSFDDYKMQFTATKKTDDEIMEDVEAILSNFSN